MGQANYGAAKAGVAAFTQILGEELWRYGILSNAIAPSAPTQMTQGLTGYQERLAAREGGAADRRLRSARAIGVQGRERTRLQGSKRVATRP